jgi:hypothetical protein
LIHTSSLHHPRLCLRLLLLLLPEYMLLRLVPKGSLHGCRVLTPQLLLRPLLLLLLLLLGVQRDLLVPLLLLLPRWLYSTRAAADCADAAR